MCMHVCAHTRPLTHTHTNTGVCETLESKQVLCWFLRKKTVPNVFCKQTGMGGTDTEDTCCEDTESVPAPVTLPHEAVRPTLGKKKELPKPKSWCGHCDLLAPGIESQGPLCNLCSWYHTEEKTGLGVPRCFLDHHPAPVLRVKY